MQMCLMAMSELAELADQVEPVELVALARRGVSAEPEARAEPVERPVSQGPGVSVELVALEARRAQAEQPAPRCSCRGFRAALRSVG